MFKFILTFILTCSTSVFAEGKQLSLQEFLSQKFGPKISKALSSKTLAEVESALGKATLVEKSHLYYELEGFKYAFSATIKDGKVTNVFYHPKTVELTLRDFESQQLIDRSKIRPVKKNGVDDGLRREYVDKESGIRLVFKTNKEMSLSTVEVVK